MFGYGTRKRVFRHRLRGLGFAMSNITMYSEMVERAREKEKPTVKGRSPEAKKLCRSVEARPRKRS